jgi:regulator of protease activity HflC (stomatin/prohibitin superfamily)
MRLIVLTIGILLMGTPAYFGLWPFALVAAALTALALIRLFDLYRSIPFLLILLGFLSFFLAGSSGSPSSPFDILRGTLFAALSLGVSLLSAMACAEVLVVYRGGTRRMAYNMMVSLLVAPVFPTTNPLRRLFARLTSSFRALQIIQDGQVIYSMPPNEDFRMAGPGTLIIRSGSAAVLEQSGKITRVVGPGFYLTESFEHLCAIVDLSLQSKSWKLEDVLTKESVPLEVEFTVQYRIMVDQPALIKKAEYKLDEDTIRRAVLTTAGWNEQTEIIAKSVLRDTIATRFLDEIYDPRSLHFSSGATPRIPLQHEMRRRLSQQSQRWGVEIVHVSLDKITLPEEVRRRMIEAWDVNWHEVVEIARAVTEARAITTKALGEGEADYVKAVKAARARLETAGVDGLVKLLNTSAELEAAKIGAQRTVIEAKAKADAQMIEGRGKAVAEAERFRQVLTSLQRDLHLDEQTLREIIVKLCGVMTTASEFQGMLRLMGQQPRLPMPGEPPSTDGDHRGSPGQ